MIHVYTTQCSKKQLISFVLYCRRESHNCLAIEIIPFRSPVYLFHFNIQNACSSSIYRQWKFAQYASCKMYEESNAASCCHIHGINGCCMTGLSVQGTCLLQMGKICMENIYYTTYDTISCSDGISTILLIPCKICCDILWYFSLQRTLGSW